MNEKPFLMLMEEHRELLLVKTDEEILTDLEELSVLPDEYFWFGKKGLDNPVWDEPATEMLLARYLALAGVIAERKLRAGVPLLLERASYGDMGETMRGLRHALEAAFEPDWEALNDVCMQAANSKNRGARLWSIAELGIIRDQRSLDVLFDALYDPAVLVRHRAIRSLGSFAYNKPNLRDTISTRFRQFLTEQAEMRSRVQEELDYIHVESS